MSSLPALQAEVEDTATRQQKSPKSSSRVHAEIESDPSLTVVGKRERLEPLHAEVVEQIDTLRAREKAAVRGVKEELERRLFGLSATASNDPARVVSFRTPSLVPVNWRTLTTPQSSMSRRNAPATISSPQPYWREPSSAAGPRSNRTSWKATRQHAATSTTWPH